MNRRGFFKLLAAAVVVPVLPMPAPAPPVLEVPLMVVGTVVGHIAAGEYGFVQVHGYRSDHTYDGVRYAVSGGRAVKARGPIVVRGASSQGFLG